MTHRIVPGDGLVTRYAPAPKIMIETSGDRRPTVRMRFPSSSAPAGEVFRVTELTFSRVVEYRWNDFEFGLVNGNDDDVRFSLIEVADSELVRRILEEGKFASFPAGQRLGGVLDESDLHHYRIAFDDHGVYDVVSVGLKITYSESPDHDLYR